jgi:hypothetical protein
MAGDEKCAFCGAEIVEPFYATVGGKKYAFNAKACADSFMAERKGGSASKIGGLLALVGGGVSLYSGLTATSMSSGSMSAATSTTGWTLIVLGVIVLATGLATLLLPRMVPMEAGRVLMEVYGILMLVIALSGILSLRLVTMNMSTSWVMLALGLAMMVIGGFMLTMKGGMAGATGHRPGRSVSMMTTYSLVLSLVVVLLVGGLAFYGGSAGTGGQQSPCGNQSTTTTQTTTTTHTMTPGNQTSTTIQTVPSLTEHSIPLPNAAYAIPGGGYQVINFTVPSNAANASVQFSFTATGTGMSNNIQIYVFDDAGLTNWMNGQGANYVYSTGQQTSGSPLPVTLSTGNYHIVLDNTYSSQASKQVQFSGTMTYWA